MADIRGTAGDDDLAGTDRPDRISGLAGLDILSGLGGDDVLLGQAGDDELRGGDGDDLLVGGAGDDLLLGEAGDDRLGGGPGDDRLFGQDGDDRLRGGDGDDRLIGGDGDDILYGGAGADRLWGEAGRDHLIGDAGDDLLTGGDGDDVLRGGPGDDLLWGEAGDDRLAGGAGRDGLSGSDGSDVLRGGDGADVLSGDAGDDLLLGEAGADALNGGDGDDVLNGGPGDDVLTGGPGRDTFAIGNVAHGLDVVTDFDPAEDGFDLSLALLRYDPGDTLADFVRLGATADGTVLSLDPTGRGRAFRDVALLEGVAVDSLTPEQLGLPLPVPATPDPIPERIVPGGLAVELVDFVRVPPSSDARPLARINTLFHADDGSGRLFVADSNGPIYAIRDSVLDPEPFLDLRDVLGASLRSGGVSDGLRDFAFHPDFENPGAPGYGKVYTAYTVTTASAARNPDTPIFRGPTTTPHHHDVIAEWTVDRPNDPVGRIDPASRRELLRIEQPYNEHNIGEIAFNPNARPGDPDYGLLYAGIGGGGLTQGVDAFRTGQDTGLLSGKIIRIDPLQHGDRPYGVPDDNPFVGRPGFLPEIWAYGLRHPEFLSWDTGGDGKMLIADIGQHNVEEVNLGIAGANYGWSEREGTFVVDHAQPLTLYPLPPHDGFLGFTYPVAQFDHDEGFAVAGGFVYRGTRIPELRGKYLFGDINGGRVFYVDADALQLGRQAEIRELTLVHEGRERTLREILGNDFRTDLRFGQDEAGELYIMTKRDGVIRELRPVDGRSVAAAEPLTPEELFDDGGGPPPPAGSSAPAGAPAAAIAAAGMAFDDLLGDGSGAPPV